MEKTKRAKTGFWKKEIKTIIIKNLNFFLQQIVIDIQKAQGSCSYG